MQNFIKLNMHKETKSYFLGFLFSLVLTIFPFILVIKKFFCSEINYIIFLCCAVSQIVIHFVYFLHLDFSEKRKMESYNFIICYNNNIYYCIWFYMDYVQLKSSYDVKQFNKRYNIYMFKHYLEIIKPGIIIGNATLIVGSFLFASRNVTFDFFLFLYTILGASLVIASACVFNNLIDFDIDKKMQRTSNRVLSKNCFLFDLY